MNQEKGEEKRKPGFSRPFSLLQIYQLRKAIFWSDEWGAPHSWGIIHLANQPTIRTNVDRVNSVAFLDIGLGVFVSHAPLDRLLNFFARMTNRDCHVEQ